MNNYKNHKEVKEQFEKFLRDIYCQLTGRKFVSVRSYLSYVGIAAKYIGFAPEIFFNATSTQFKTWEFKLKDNPAFQNLSYEYRYDILSGYHALILFKRYQQGFVSIS